MTDKSDRQRGGRTHGGGSQKNGRGAGNSGGRGGAGRVDHDFHGREPIGKSGFTRPQTLERAVEEVSVGDLDADIAVHVAAGIAEETDEGYRVDARDVVEDGHEVDAVKVLGGGQVHAALTVVADDFSETAVERLEAAGGTAQLSDRAEAEAEAEAEADGDE